MTRKRNHLTTDILADALHRLGIGADAVDRETLRLRMDLPEQNGFVEDETVAAALRDGGARQAFAETGVAALRSTIPALRSEPVRAALVWRMRVSIPLLDDGRLDLRLDVPPGETAAEILEEMALGNDPTRRLDDLRAALAGTAAEHEGTSRRTIARLREQTLVGAGANPLSKKYTVGFEATGTLKRTEFGVKTYVPLIGDELHLTIAGAFERQD